MQNEHCDTAPEESFAVCRGIVGEREGSEIAAFESDCRRDVECKSNQCAENADNDVSFVNRAAEFVVDGPVPRCVGVTVEENSRLDFAGAFLDSSNVVSGFSGKKPSMSFLYIPNCTTMMKKPSAMRAAPSAGMKKNKIIPASAKVMVK